VRRPDLRVTARNGYYGEAEDDPGARGARISVDPGGNEESQLRQDTAETPAIAPPNKPSKR
jgi:hypothetical protein